MTTAFLAHVLGPGDHASRPDPATVPYGALYACTDHGTLDQNVAGTWGTYATLGGASDHGALSGLSDDDHPQYATNAEFDDHSARHQSGGADAVKLDDLAAPDDNTDLDATTSAHGLLPKLGGGSTDFLRADGTWNAPPGGGGISSGTSNPGSPSAGDLFFRTDLGLLIFYDGTRWLTTDLLTQVITSRDDLITASGVTSSDNAGRCHVPWQGAYGLWLVRWDGQMIAGATIDGSLYWTQQLNWSPADDSTDNIIGSAVQLTAAGVFQSTSQAIGAVLHADARHLQMRLTKVGTPGDCWLASMTLYYRLIVT